MHIGSAAVAARVRPLDGDGAPAAAGRRRCRCGSATGCCCATPARGGCCGADVLDVDPPALRRRGAARARAAELAEQPPGDGRGAGRPGPAPVRPARGLRRHGLAGAGRGHRGRRLAARAGAGRRAGGPGAARGGRYRQLRPLEPGPPVAVLRSALELPDVELVPGLVRPPLALREGRVVVESAGLPPAVQRAVDGVRARLADDPFAAPDAGDLAAAGLGPRELAAAVRDETAGADRRRASTCCPASPRWRGPGWPTCRSRSRSARRGRRGGPAGGSPSRWPSGSMPAGSPSGSRTTPAGCAEDQTGPPPAAS